MFVYENRISITIIFYEHYLANIVLNLEARFINPCEFYNTVEPLLTDTSLIRTPL